MSTNMPNLKQIGGGHCKTLVDLTWNDPIAQEKHLKLLVARTTGADVEEIINAPGGAEVPLENWDEFEELRSENIICPVRNSKTML